MNNDTDKPRSEPLLGNTAQPPATPWSLPPALAELWNAGQSDIVMELIQLFLSDTRERLDLLQQALEGGELEKLKRMAHSIKGSCSQMGENRMAQLGKQMEEKFGSGTIEGGELLLASLNQQFESSSKAIRAFLESLG